jgi:hypothetical protein
MRLVHGLMAAAAALGFGPSASAAIMTRSFSLTASNFANFFNAPSPLSSLSDAFTLTYDDAVSGYQSAPISFTAVTNAGTNVGPFSATPIVGYFPASAFSAFPRLLVGGAIGGGNVLESGKDDFFFSFDASAIGATPAMLGFIVKGNPIGFLATYAVVTPSANAPVPEPRTWALFIAGFGLIGGMMRRRSGPALPDPLRV